jgi:hypothetical protein
VSKLVETVREVGSGVVSKQASKEESAQEIEV